MYPDGEFSNLDGIAISYPTWRLNVRTSNTEPLLRLNVEGDTDQLVQSKTNDIKTPSIIPKNPPKTVKIMASVKN